MDHIGHGETIDKLLADQRNTVDLIRGKGLKKSDNSKGTTTQSINVTFTEESEDVIERPPS